ncbi:MAG: ABC transporter ATP-binding protein [Pseudomonadota bacterium]
MQTEYETADAPQVPGGHPARLSARGITLGYGAEPIICDLSLDIPTAELTAIVGPNGCGKSTLLKAFARVLPVSGGGVIELDGRPVHETPTREVAKKLALLPQGPIAPEGLTVRELVSQGRFPYQSLVRQWSREDARAVTEAMAAANVTDLADRRVSELSGGQRQRCWIAMVLAQETDLLLLDEPTTFLDLKVQVELMTLLRDVAHDQGRTLVVVMHELNVAAAFADSLVMMRDGSITAQGPVDHVFTAENLDQVFGLDAAVLNDPESGRPVCVPRVSLRPDIAAQ